MTAGGFLLIISQSPPPPQYAGLYNVGWTIRYTRMHKNSAYIRKRFTVTADVYAM